MNYARWRKCDFQVHSPRDRNWTGPRPVGDSDRLQWARDFVDKCVEKDLEAVALTDHHDVVMVSFVQEVIEDRKRNDPEFDLYFFPGMELTVRGGKQCLILFDANLSEERYRQAQGSLGIESVATQEESDRAPRVRQLQFSYPEIASHLDVLERVRNRYIILPNVSQGGQHTVLIQRGYRDFSSMPYVGGYLDARQTIESLSHTNRHRLSGNSPRWSRRYIYPLPTSDSRSADFSNLGTNNTWIKIAEPTAESIRQAFLAHKSRIRIEEPKLPSFVITRVEVDNSTILESEKLDFSPELNAIIGGRGSGKSTFLEYVAFALGKSSWDIPRDHYGGTKRMQSLIDLFQSKNGRVSLDVRRDNATFRIVRGPETDYNPKVFPKNQSGDIVSGKDLRRVFPAVVYSQGELADIGGQYDGVGDHLSGLLQFVDPSYKRKDEQSRLAIKSSKDSVRSAIQDAVGYWRVLSEHRRLEIEVMSMSQRAEALEKALPERSEEDDAILKRYDAATEFNTKLVQASKRMDKLLNKLGGVDSELQSERDLETTLDGVAIEIRGEYRDFYTTFRSGTLKLLNRLKAKRNDFKVLEGKWQVSYNNLSDQRRKVLEKLGSHKDDTNKIINLRKEITQQQGKIAELKSEESKTTPLDRLQIELDNLRTICDKRDQDTQEWAATIERLSGGKIKATVELEEDTEEIQEAINKIAARTGSREPIRERNLKDAIVKSKSALELIDTLYKDCLNLLKWREMGKPYGKNRPRCKTLMGILGGTERTRDRVVKLMDSERTGAIATAVAKPGISLHFCDGDREISFDKASDGQRAAALLFMLLDQSGGPLIIDQPEGDLDNRIITELTDKLHNAKEKRQLIFSSHNANLIVNGSSEIVVQLDITDTGSREFACVGAIDRPDVCKVITSTMEGGEKAFRDRKEKYGF